MRIYAMVTVLLFLCSEIIKAETFNNEMTFDTLIGTLPSIVKCNKVPYLVPSNIEVPPDRTVTIEPGTVFLFKNFAGLHIRGKLIVHGTTSDPVIFTSEFDRNYNATSIRDANPFDWDGIYLNGDAIGSQMSNCSILYSVYGIKSETKFIRLDPITLKDNGKNTIFIDNSEFQITDSIFSYILEKKDAIKDGVPIELFKDPLSKKRLIFKILGITLFAGGLGSSIYFASEYHNANSKLSELSSSDFENLNRNASKDWEKSKDNTTKYKFLCGSGALITVAGIISFSWSFTF